MTSAAVVAAPVASDRQFFFTIHGVATDVATRAVCWLLRVHSVPFKIVSTPGEGVTHGRDINIPQQRGGGGSSSPAPLLRMLCRTLRLSPTWLGGTSSVATQLELDNVLEWAHMPSLERKEVALAKLPYPFVCPEDYPTIADITLRAGLEGVPNWRAKTVPPNVRFWLEMVREALPGHDDLFSLPPRRKAKL